MYRSIGEGLEFLLVHPGGPFWKNKDAGAWTIPKGELQVGEDALEAAKREFVEELGIEATGPFTARASVQQKGGKTILAWAFEGDCDPTQCSSNTFEIEWPPKSGRLQQFPEVDRVAWLSLEQAAEKLNPAQLPLLQEVVSKKA